MPSLDSYYQPDFSHRSNKPKASKRSTAPQYDIGLDGVPVRTSGVRKIPSMMTPGEVYGDPTPTIQPGGRPRGAMFMDPVGPAPKMPGASSFMDPVAPKDADVTKLATTPGRQIAETENDVAFVRDSTINNGRDNSRTNPNGIVQKGTDMSRSFNDLLATTNTSGYQPFSSNQLPTTGANPFSAQPPKTQSFDVAAPGVTGSSYDNYGAVGGVAAASSTDRSEFTPMSGTEGRIEGGSDRKAGGSLADALSDTAGINSYMSKFSSGDQERLANRAFLDTKGSMEGLRAKEAVNGVVYAQGQHYVAGADADGPAQKISRDNARDISSGNAKAQDFLKAKIDTTIDTQKKTPAEEQDPLSAAGSAVKSGFAAGAKTDFSLNNNQAKPQVGVGPVVPTDQIPKDLSGAAGKKYLADLDAGKLF